MSHGTTTVSTVGTGTAGQPSAGLTNLAAIGYVETSFLTGQGRDLNSVTANITLGEFVDDQLNKVVAPNGSVVNLQVDAYGGPQVIRTPVTFGQSTTLGGSDTAPNSRHFSTYEFLIDSLTTQSLGSLITSPNIYVITGGTIGADTVTTAAITSPTMDSPVTFKADIRAFPGRFASFTVRLDPNTVGINNQTSSDGSFTSPRGIFELDMFDSINFPSGTDTFQSVLSDYLSFDISAMPAPPANTSTTALKNWQPSITQNGVTVVGQRVFFSGDTYALAGSTSSGDLFQLTGDISGTGSQEFLHGTFSTNASIGGATGSSYTLPSGVSSLLPGTYALDEIDVSDTSFLRRILSLEGMFADTTRMINTTANAIAFPSSADNNVQDLVVFKRATSGTNNGKIIDLYYGYVDYEAQACYLFPIYTLPSAVSATTYTGKVTATFNALGNATINQQATRTGNLVMNSGNAITFSDGTTYTGGQFIVYRR